MTKEKRLGRGLAALLGTVDGQGDDESLKESSPEQARSDSHSARSPGVSEGYESQEDPGPVTVPHPAVARQRTSPLSRDEIDRFMETGPSKRSPNEEPPAGLLQLNVYEIDDNPFQPRRDFSEPEIVSLAESLKTHQMLQPVLVRRIGDRYQLISGERRLRAAIHAGWKKIPAQIREADDRLVAELAIVENLQRKDLNPIEKGLSFKRYLDQHQCTQEDLAKRLKIDRSTIANLIRLLELPATVLDALRKGSISAGHARALLPLGEETLQNEFCQKITEEGWSVRATEHLVQERIREEDAPELHVVGSEGPGEGGAQVPAKKRRTMSHQIASLEQQLRHALGTKVDIRQTAKGRGRIVIHFNGHEEFERIHGYLTDGDLEEACEA